MHEAAVAGQLEAVRFLIDNHADIRAIETSGESALHKAIDGHSADVVKLLLERGCDPNERVHDEAWGDNRETPLILAARSNILPVIGTLLDHGAALEGKDTDGETALLLAASFNNIEACEFLLSKGADINTTNKRKQTVLHKAAFNSLGNIASRNEKTNAAPLVKLLIDKGLDVNAQDGSGCTPLYYAATGYGKALDVLDLLVHAGAGINSADKRGNTPLHQAARHGNADVVSWLLDHGADANALNADKKKPRNVASPKSPEVADLLRQHESH